MVVGILSVIFIGWHLSEKGLDLNATGNGSKLIPEEVSETYKNLQ